ncbi:MAG: Colicin V production protein [Gammaproteobacteria bacterium]|nr:Colicin V production protein [Gammaproteobacteria bacterium]
MNGADWAILAITVLSALVGIYRGFIREILSLTSWILAFWAAFSFSETVGVHFEPYIESPALRVVAAFAALFIATLLILSAISYLLYRLLLASGVSGTDRILGGLFGIVRAIVLVSVVLLLARLTAYPHEAWRDQSILVQQLNPVAVFFYDRLPPDIVKYLETV